MNTPGITFEQTKAFARAVAISLEKDDPKHVIREMSRKDRVGKVFIDRSQNGRNKTTVCVYSARARDEPTVSWPIDWDDPSRRTRPKPVRADRFEYAPNSTTTTTTTTFARTMKARQLLSG